MDEEFQNKQLKKYAEACLYSFIAKPLGSSWHEPTLQEMMVHRKRNEWEEVLYPRGPHGMRCETWNSRPLASSRSSGMKRSGRIVCCRELQQWQLVWLLIDIKANAEVHEHSHECLAVPRVGYSEMRDGWGGCWTVDQQESHCLVSQLGSGNSFSR